MPGWMPPGNGVSNSINVEPVEESSQSMEFLPVSPVTAGPLVQAPSPRRARQRRDWPAIIVVVFVLGTLGVSGWLWYPELRRMMLEHQSAESEQVTVAPGAMHRSKLYNYAIRLPAKPWEQNADIRGPLEATALGMSRSNPDMWYAIAAKDYKTYTPDVGKAFDDGLARAERYFNKQFGWEQQPDITLGGQLALRFEFQGQQEQGDVMRGELVMVAFRGIVYWFFTWMREADFVRDPAANAKEFAALRESFTLGGDREQWEERRVAKSFEGHDAPYVLKDLPGFWEEYDNPKIVDRAVDLLVQGTDPDEKSEGGAHKSDILVYILNDQADLKTATESAVALVLKIRRKDHPEAELKLWNDSHNKPLDFDLPIGGQPGHYLEFFGDDGDNRSRLVILATVYLKESKKALVIHCESDWRRRSRWQPIFQQAIKNFTLKTGGN
jgi:hypothetical protein